MKSLEGVTKLIKEINEVIDMSWENGKLSIIKILLENETYI